MSEKIARLAVGLLIGIWLARYLGPEEYGLLNYALAIVSMLAPLATLGLHQLIVNEVVKAPDTASEVLGSALVLRFFSGAVAVGLAVLAAYFLSDGEDSRLIRIVSILSLIYLFQALEVIKSWFEAIMALRYVVWVQLITLALVSLARVYLILTNAPLEAFAWVITFETAIAMTALLAGVLLRSDFRLKLRWERLMSLVRHGWPLTFSGLAIVVYLRIDQIMLGKIAGEQAVGVYSAALRLSEAWYFVPSVVVMAVFPGILRTRLEDKQRYQQAVQSLLDRLVLSSLLVALLISLSSYWLVVMLYGSAYAEASTVLAVHVWAGVFVAMGVASARWYVAEGLQLLQLYKALLGTISNVALNFLLIPDFGAAGAAIATLVSYIISAYLSDLLMTDTRPMFRMKHRALLFFVHYWQR